MKIGGPARYFAVVSTKDQVAEAVAWAKQHEVKFFPLGEGSNIIFTDRGFNGLVIKIEIPGFKEVGKATFKIGAGENWDKIVDRGVDRGLSGIECLSLIPGTAGATPVQNVGAYGQEIKDTLVELTAYDSQADRFVTLSNSDCKFSYRNSIFKSTESGRYIICDITLTLKKPELSPPFYDSLQRYLNQHSISDYSPASLRKAVISIRQAKLPDPKQIPNTGSFFKNPYISQAKFEQLRQQFPGIKGFPTQDKVKVPAGWLIENAELAGVSFDNVGLHDNNALVLTSSGQATFQELLALKELIIDKVQSKFGIALEQEPQTID